MMKQGLFATLGLLLLSSTALADEYRGHVVSPNITELDINFSDSHYDSQIWQRPDGGGNIKYHDTLVVLFNPGCVVLETGAPPPNTSSTDTMFYVSYSGDTSNNDWYRLDDDSGDYYLSVGYLRYENSGDRRVRIRTTGYNSNINNQAVNIHIRYAPLSECPTGGSNVAFL